MKKSKIIVISALIFVVLLFISVYLVYNSLFPKAPPIVVPDFDQDMTIIAEDSHGTFYDEHTHDVLDSHRCILDKIYFSKPTRIMSANDYPAGEDYIKVSCVCNDRTYTYYLYEKNGTTYVEVPYEGVYIVD